MEPGDQNCLGQTTVSRVMVLPAALSCAAFPRESITWRKKEYELSCPEELKDILQQAWTKKIFISVVER